MDLKSGYPFWAVKNGLMRAFPALQSDLRCEVAVVGGGITGALIADALTEAGHEVVVLEQRDIGWGSTAASTALLQYEIDTHLVDLAERYGEADAVEAYRGCAEAIESLHALAGEVRDVGFARTHSLYYASRQRDRAALEAEFSLRRRHGFDVRWFEPESLQARYGFRAPAAILSATAAQVDPYRFTYRLLARRLRGGMQVFDRTVVSSIDATTRGVTLRTQAGPVVRAGHVVLAAGYATQHWLDRLVARNRSSYAFVTDPLDEAALGPLRRTLVWESARPYLYLRTTQDSRLLVGGEDDAVDRPARRDARVDRKARRIAAKAGTLLPHLDIVPTFSWGGTFAETADGLPFIGPHAQYGPRVVFVMAYGGNGITYSMLGAGLVSAYLARRRHPLQALFGFGRLER
ncbi:MAG: amino acid oxidase [Rhodanobacter denitrificans]|uniref:Amino acid oxidase n=1 Tax=Rhodanobacter denitrificans TaxID=666685 RepID=A0A2W5K040_9GAMM|nr:MAG: amino acid oxidase [Rhodanobacter denitrificans]